MEFIVSTNYNSCTFYILTCWLICPSSSEAWRWSTIRVAIWRDDYDIYTVHVAVFFSAVVHDGWFWIFLLCVSFFSRVCLFPGSFSCSFLLVLKHLHVSLMYGFPHEWYGISYDIRYIVLFHLVFKVYILNLFYYCHDSWLSVMLDWKQQRQQQKDKSQVECLPTCRLVHD